MRLGRTIPTSGLGPRCAGLVGLPRPSAWGHQPRKQSGCDECTAVALAKGRGAPTLIVLTTGGFSEGRKAPARVLRLPYRSPPR